MGIVASIIATPVAQAVAEDEARRELERLRLEEERLQRMKQAEMYRMGDSELEVIKRLSTEINVTEQHSPERSKFREGLTKVSDVEKVYLTGTYKAKYKMLGENLAANSSFKLFPPPELDGSLRKTRSAYPSVRIRPNTSTYRVYSQHSNPHINFVGTPRHSHYIETPKHFYHQHSHQQIAINEIQKQNGLLNNSQTPKHKSNQTPKHKSKSNGHANQTPTTPKLTASNFFASLFTSATKNTDEDKIKSSGNGVLKQKNHHNLTNPTPKHVNKSIMGYSNTPKHQNQMNFNSTLKAIKQH